MTRALLAGVLAAVGLAALAILLANAVRCIDSGPFDDPRAVVWTATGAGLLTAGAVVFGSGRMRVGATVALIGLLVLAYGIVGPPYKSCGQFFVPL